MSGLLRRKLASSISVIQEGEDFLYNASIRAPLHKSIPVGNISYSSILDTSYLTFGFEKPFLSKPFFNLGNSSVSPEDLKYLFVKKVKTNAVFFQLLYIPSKIVLHRDIEPKPSGPSAKRIDFKMKKAANSNVDVKLVEPDIKDYLQNLKATVEKIELLNMEDSLSDGNDTVIEEINVKDFKNVTKNINVRSFGKLKVKKIKSDGIKKIPKLNKIEVPGIGEYKAKVSTINLPSLIIAAVSKSPLLNFIPPSVSSKVLSFLSSETINCDLADVQKITHEPREIVDELNELVNVSEPQEIVDELNESSNVSEPQEIVDEIDESVNVSEPVKHVLKTSHKVEWAKRQDPDIILNEYEDKNTRFLVENKRALLEEEPGLNKIKESVAALKFLFQNGVINSTLVLIPAGILGHSEKAKQLGVSNGWIGNLEKYCYDMSYSVIRGDDNERLDAWNKSANIHIVDHKTF